MAGLQKDQRSNPIKKWADSKSVFDPLHEQVLKRVAGGVYDLFGTDTIDPSEVVSPIAMPLIKGIKPTRQLLNKLANAQRGVPESKMLKVQNAAGGGVLSPTVEHVGDILHRMNEEPTFRNAGYEFVKPKVEKTLKWLTNPYGFRKEYSENIVNNASYRGEDPKKLQETVSKLLQEYGTAHEALPTYNRAQRIAQKASTSLGDGKFDKAADYLRMLQTHLSSPEEWKRFAHFGLEE